MSVISLDEWRKKQALLSKSKSPLAQSIPWDELGLTHIEVTNNIKNLMALYVVLDRAWRQPFTLKSDFARTGAFHVALAASEGFISTKVDVETWGKRWLITEVGMEVKGELDDILREIIEEAGNPFGPHSSH